jgi:hypothetical protein
MARLPVIAAAPILPGLALAQPTDDAARCHAAGSYLCIPTKSPADSEMMSPGVPR